MKIFGKFDLSKKLSSLNIKFIELRYYFMLFSLGLIFLTMMLLILKGLNFGIDFTGGITFQLKFEEKQNIADVRKNVSQVIKNYELQSLGTASDTFLLRVKGKFEEAESIKKSIGNVLKNFRFEKAEYVGPKIGKYLKKQAIFAVLCSFGGIIVYIGFRFKSLIWGLAGVVALIHDVFITVGFLSFLGREFNITTIAGLLTLAGYSINDTIVIFDRIRENLNLMRKEDLRKIMNLSINKTLSRTLFTSFTALLVVLVIFLFGGEPVKDFALALFFGLIIGTYSTLGIASPIVYEYYTSRK